MSQLEVWQGEFGQAYTDRNVADWRARQPGFRQMLEALSLRSVLEVGCNRGHNLVAISDLLGEDADVVGIEPNRHAQRIARTASDRIAVLNGNAFDLLWQRLWQRLLGRPVSEYGRLCHGAGGPEGGGRCRRAFMLTCMKRLAVSSRGVSLLVLGSHRHG